MTQPQQDTSLFTDNRTPVEIWTDGSGTTDQEPGGWAAILRFRKGGEWIEREYSGGVEFTTSQRMEITAVLEALKHLKRPCRVTLYTDSQYVAFTFSKGWLAKWLKNKKEKKNMDLWRQIHKLLAMHSVDANWIRGHVGTELNERCDVLAGEQRARLMSELESAF